MTTTALINLKNNRIVTQVCHEPEGDFERSIRPMPLSVDNLESFWKRAKQYRTLFNEEIKGDFKKFMNVFLHYDKDNKIQTNGLFWVLDNFNGVYYITKITPGIDALCHVNMLDGRFKGREEITKKILLYAFEEYGFHRLTVQVPVYIKPNVIRFIRNVGFVSEGRLRGLVEYHDKWFDVFSFSIFKDEIKLKG